MGAGLERIARVMGFTSLGQDDLLSCDRPLPMIGVGHKRERRLAARSYW